ncbi:MAG: hypothetical protein Q9160_009176 [Pyrenula sp. 1 TL-2023]
MTTQPLRQVRVGVGAFVLDSSQESSSKKPRFLIGKRVGSHGAGTYALPGGHLEFGETPETCAIREVLEETGLKVSKPRFLTATNDYMPAEDKHYVTLFIVCVREDEGNEPQVLEPEKCEGWEWVTWKEIVTWAAREEGDGNGKAVEQKLFLPLLNLVRQRPGVTPTSTL